MDRDKLNNLRAILNSGCLVCGRHTAFLFAGIQEGLGFREDSALYNCFECGATRAELSLYREKKREE